MTTHLLFTEEMETFDPLRDLFVAQTAKPAHITDINLRTLTPFQRALLVIDGTVTTFIEAYTMEPVEVVLLGQEQRRLADEHPWLEAPKGTLVLARQVILRGQYSFTFHAYAVSLIVPDRLERSVRQGLEQEGEGLGRMLLKSRQETRREILWYGREHASGLPDAIRRMADGEFMTRAYRIIAGGKPVMLINEKFPLGIDRLPSHH